MEAGSEETQPWNAMAAGSEEYITITPLASEDFARHTCWRTVFGRSFKKDDCVSVGGVWCQSGRNIQFELNGTWVDDNVLHTEEDSRMEIEL